MKLTEISVNNFQSVRGEAKLDPLETVNGLIGPNNQGKTSLLQALHLVKRLVISDWSDTIANEYMTERLPDKDSTNTFEIQLKFTLDASDICIMESDMAEEALPSIGATIRWGGQVPGGNLVRMYPVEVIVSFPDHRAIRVVRLRDSGEGGNFLVREYRLQILRNSSTSPAGLRPDQLLGLLQRSTSENEVFRFLGNWAKKIIYVSSLREVVSIGQPGQPTDVISGLSLPGLLHRIRNNQESRFGEFETLIRTLIPTIGKIHTYVEDNNNVSVRVSFGDGDAEGAHRLDTVGSGVSEIFYLAAMIWMSDEGSTVLIEEPERGLHPLSQRLLVRHAVKHAKENSKQLFWATHSSVIGSLMDDSTLHLVTFQTDGSTITTHIDQSRTNLVRESMGQSNLDVYTHDVAVFFDGESEKAVLPAIINHLLGPGNFGTVRCFPLNGDISSKKEMLSHLVDLTIANHSRVFIFADDDNDARTAKEDLLRSRRSDHPEELRSLQIHIWDCGVQNASEGKRGAEFEDNFSHNELVGAANRLGGGEKLEASVLNARANEQPSKMVSKVLERYYHDVGYEGWSKVKLGDLLGQDALSKIGSDKPRGPGGSGYEFEKVIVECLRPMIPNL